MPLILPGNVASATAPTTFSVANSCRFNDGDSPYMHKTPGGAGNVDTWTFSCWVKRGALGTQQRIFSVGDHSDGNPLSYIELSADDTLRFDNYQGGTEKIQTTRKFRDVSAWFNIVLSVDTTNGTAGDRYRLYINGIEETSFSTDNNPSVNQDTSVNSTSAFHLGSFSNNEFFFDGYMAEVCMIDGSQLAATSFGEFDEDSPTIWKPIDVSGLTFGTNGFYLDFEASANLGNDANGGTDLTEVNFAAVDQATDTPTNNFCTVNPLDNFYSAATISQGNNYFTYGGGSIYSWITGTMGVSAGKWYWESYSYHSCCGRSGIASGPTTSATTELGTTYSWAYLGSGNLVGGGATLSGYGSSYTANHVLGNYLDLDNNKYYVSLDGTIQNSGTGVDITATASNDTGLYFPAFSNNAGGPTIAIATNFGGCPGWTLSSAVADANGYGAFEYDPSDGGSSSFDSAAKDFLALCTKNLGSDGG